MIQQNSLEVGISLALLAAVAIVATLLSVTFETKFQSRWAAYASVLFGASAVLGVAILADLLREQLQGYESIVARFSGYFALAATVTFLVATEILVFIAVKKFWKKGKVTKR